MIKSENVDFAFELIYVCIIKFLSKSYIFGEQKIVQKNGFSWDKIIFELSLHVKEDCLLVDLGNYFPSLEILSSFHLYLELV